MKIKKIEQSKSKLKAKREVIKHLGKSVTAQDNIGNNIRIRGIVEIVNNYTSFKIRFPDSKRSRDALERGNSVARYNSDKFGEVTHLERSYHRGTKIGKTRFITDSGFKTWRIANNLLIYNGGRGSFDNEKGAGKDHFYESRTE